MPTNNKLKEEQFLIGAFIFDSVQIYTLVGLDLEMGQDRAVNQFKEVSYTHAGLTRIKEAQNWIIAHYPNRNVHLAEAIFTDKMLLSRLTGFVRYGWVTFLGDRVIKSKSYIT